MSTKIGSWPLHISLTATILALAAPPLPAQCKMGGKGQQTGMQQTGMQQTGMQQQQQQGKIQQQLQQVLQQQQTQQVVLQQQFQQGLRQQQVQQKLQQFQQGLRQQKLEQSLVQQTTGLSGLQSQLQNGLTGSVQQLRSDLLTALQQQRQLNSFLLALRKKQEQTVQSYQTGNLNGFATITEQAQFQDALQTALQQTEFLLTALQQMGGTSNNPWQTTLQRQSTSLTAQSKLLPSQSSD